MYNTNEFCGNLSHWLCSCLNPCVFDYPHSGRLVTTLPSPSPFSHQFQKHLPVLAPAPVLALPPAPHMAVPIIYQQPPYRAPTDRIFYLTHTCQPACLTRIRPSRPDKHRGKNPLLTPLLYDFRRMTGRRKVNRKVGALSTWAGSPGGVMGEEETAEGWGGVVLI